VFVCGVSVCVWCVCVCVVCVYLNGEFQNTSHASHEQVDPPQHDSSY
jgi:hypothetical protein